MNDIKYPILLTICGLAVVIISIGLIITNYIGGYTPLILGVIVMIIPWFLRERQNLREDAQ